MTCQSSSTRVATHFFFSIFLGLQLVEAAVHDSQTVAMSSHSTTSKNVFGRVLAPCSMAPMTGFYRNGFCETGPQDVGRHTVCAQVTSAFLSFTRDQGNDLTAPNPHSAFPGLQEGDRWCLCVDRWREVERNGEAPRVVLEATHERALDRAGLQLLKEYSTAQDE